MKAKIILIKLKKQKSKTFWSIFWEFFHFMIACSAMAICPLKTSLNNIPV